MLLRNLPLLPEVCLHILGSPLQANGDRLRFPSISLCCRTGLYHQGNSAAHCQKIILVHSLNENAKFLKHILETSQKYPISKVYFGNSTLCLFTKARGVHLQNGGLSHYLGPKNLSPLRWIRWSGISAIQTSVSQANLSENFL